MKRLRRYPGLTESFDTSSEEEEEKEPVKPPKKKLAPLIVIPSDEEAETEELVEEEDEEPKLSESQKRALDMILQGHNVFVTGEAGSGKSYLIEQLRQALEERQTHYQMTASTGSAAWNIGMGQAGGVTLHSFAGIGLGNREDAETYVAQIQKRRDKLKDWQWIECLIIDEISMIQVEYFEKLEKIARLLKNGARPFGGIQLVLVGDYFQCPPIVKDGEKRQYLFESPLWQQLHIQCCALTQNFRQSQDPAFRALLGRMKIGQLTRDDLITMRTRIIHNHGQCNEMTRLCSRRANAESINKREIEKLEGEAHHYKGDLIEYDANGIPLMEEQKKKTTSDENKFNESNFPVDVNLQLKKGTLIILCCNLDVSAGLFNGSRGMVVDFRRESNANNAPLYPFVEFEQGQRVLISPHKWDSFKKRRLVSTFVQIPLMPRYAMTIHKSQGLTLDQALVTMDFFDTGLAYVAFSRVRQLEHLFLTNVDEKKVLVDPVVVAFARHNGLL